MWLLKLGHPGHVSAKSTPGAICPPLQVKCVANVDIGRLDKFSEYLLLYSISHYVKTKALASEGIYLSNR